MSAGVMASAGSRSRFHENEAEARCESRKSETYTVLRIEVKGRVVQPTPAEADAAYESRIQVPGDTKKTYFRGKRREALFHQRHVRHAIAVSDPSVKVLSAVRSWARFCFPNGSILFSVRPLTVQPRPRP